MLTANEITRKLLHHGIILAALSLSLYVRVDFENILQNFNGIKLNSKGKLEQQSAKALVRRPIAK